MKSGYFNSILVFLLFFTCNLVTSQSVGGKYYMQALQKFEEGQDQEAIDLLYKGSYDDPEFANSKLLYFSLEAKIKFASSTDNSLTKNFNGFSFMSINDSGKSNYDPNVLGWWANSDLSQVYQFYHSQRENKLRVITYTKDRSEHKFLLDSPVNFVKSSNGNEYFELVWQDQNYRFFQPFKFKISGNTIGINAIESNLTKVRSNSELLRHLDFGSVTYSETGILKRATAEYIENKRSPNYDLALILLVGALVFGNSSDGVSYNNNYDSKPVTPYGYDREGNPVYDKVTPIYFNPDGRKRF